MTEGVSVGICDDVLLWREEITDKVLAYQTEKQIQITIKQYSCAEDYLKAQDDIDILFLDIEMPHMDGIEVGRQFFEKNKDCKIIMATGREDRFKESFKINAFRFASKPYQREEIEEALESCFKIFTARSVVQLYENRMMHEVRQKDIIYIEAYDGYVEVKVGSKTMRKDCSLLQMEDILNSDIFFKISKSRIVNLMKIDFYKKGKISIEGKDILVDAESATEESRMIESSDFDLFLVSPQTKMYYSKFLEIGNKVDKLVVNIPPQAYIPVPIGIQKMAKLILENLE